MSTDDEKISDPIDVHVGARIRLIRKQQGLSQTDLADALGKTFQQVQKYERGSNRVAASTLYRTAEYLGVNIEDFFTGLKKAEDKEGMTGFTTDVFSMFRTEEGIEMARLFDRADQKKRRAVVKFLRVMLEE